LWLLAHGGAILAGAHRLPKGMEMGPEELVEAMSEVRAPRVRLQIAACIALAFPNVAAKLREQIEQDATNVPSPHKNVILELLSADECVAVAQKGHSEKFPLAAT